MFPPFSEKSMLHLLLQKNEGVKKKLMKMKMAQLWANLGSAMATVMFVWAIIRQYVPYRYWSFLNRYSRNFARFFFPYISIVFHEFSGERSRQSEAFSAIQSYLSKNASAEAIRFKADAVKGSRSVVLTMDDQEEITDEFRGVKVWWRLRKNISRTQSFSYYPITEEKRYYKLTLHKKDRKMIVDSYIDHVLEEGKANTLSNRQQKLYSNSPSRLRGRWSRVIFEHPASFDTMAMETKMKDEIMKDLKKFSEGKDYYAKMGKAWKRGYLLYGPPGTGKSTMVAAIANFLNYDVYDLELTAVQDNIELRNLLIETSNKSVIVIEDIDCSLDLTGQREKKKTRVKDWIGDTPEEIKKNEKEDSESKSGNITLSGLLNFIDGLWSACGGERIIIFTTNYVEKLDPALIRRGRMDKHIEMSYCRFEAFKVLAKNYLDIDSHDLFDKIGSRLAETDMTPAEVAEYLMLMSDEDDAETCLKNLIKALDLKVIMNEEARKKAEEKARSKAEEKGSKVILEENGFTNEEGRGGG